MTNQKNQKSRKGWIYYVDPHQVILQCRQHHIYRYNLPKPGKVECKHPSCKQEINSSRVFRGNHPYIIWMSEEFQDQHKSIQTFTAIPLTSSERVKGLPTTYPINPNSRNGLDRKSFALVHQICTIDAHCFKNVDGWLKRIGQLDKSDKKAIEERLRYYLDINNNPTQDWFMQNASPELVEKIYSYLSEEEQIQTLETLISKID